MFATYLFNHPFFKKNHWHYYRCPLSFPHTLCPPPPSPRHPSAGLRNSAVCVRGPSIILMDEFEQITLPHSGQDYSPVFVSVQVSRFNLNPGKWKVEFIWPGSQKIYTLACIDPNPKKVCFAEMPSSAMQKDTFTIWEAAIIIALHP